MPHYHFHEANGSRLSDEEGHDLPDDKAAKHMAVKYAGELIASSPAELWDTGHWRVEVTNTENALLWTVVTLAIEAPRPLSA